MSAKKNLWMWAACLALPPALATAQAVALTDAEAAYIRQNPVVTLCVDPDWVPFERINAQGQHEGIAADLIGQVADRLGLQLKLVPTTDWPQSMAASQAGQCQILSFLNDTPDRRQWLLFTAPVFSDPNIIITREDHRYVADLHGLIRHTLALPKGTMVAEHIQRDYPNIRLVLTDTEQQATELVASRKVDLTIRPLTVAAYTIRQQGLFNLKISGQVPDLYNHLRIGVRKDLPVLHAILDKGVRTLTPTDRERAVNRHINIQVNHGLSPALLWQLLAGFLALLGGGVFWHRKVQSINQQRLRLTEQRTAQEKHAREVQTRLVALLSHEIRTPLAMIDGATTSLGLLLPNRTDATQLRLDRIHAGVARIVALAEQFLTQDRFEQNQLPTSTKPIDPLQLCQNAVNLLGPERIQLEANATQPMLADPEMLQVAIENLIKNALKYADPQTPIHIRLAFGSVDWTLTIRNQGPCIAQDQVPTLFEPYTRATHRTDLPGSGLGLYLVCKVAQRHGGRVALTHNTQHSVEFTLTLPYSSGVSSASQA